MTKLTPEGILAELEQVIRLMPPRETMHHEDADNIEWEGRACAIVEIWGNLNLGNLNALLDWRRAMEVLHVPVRTHGADPALTIIKILFQVQNNLRMQTVGPVSVTVALGQIHQYFDEVRKIIEQATSNILFVDPYLNADFVTRYLPHVKQGVAVRLLSLKNVAAVKPAAELFAKEHKLSIEVRTGQEMHDRWLFIDGKRCFQSGASFKDGAVYASTTFIENVDSFAVLQSQYETLWAKGTI